jgi:predicted O-linked N-acetylglucosamine transferase (SPINDLY family)
MGASVLTAAGLADLIVTDLDAYVSYAVKLAMEPKLLNGFKSRLDNIATSQLFNVKRHTQHLERGYQMIAAAYQAGDLADVHVPSIDPTPQ